MRTATAALIALAAPLGSAWVPAARLSVASSRRARTAAATAPTMAVDQPSRDGRRGFMARAVGVAVAGALGASSPASPALAAEQANIDVYFGVGCFWHVQHEFIEAERSILGRSDDTITSLAAYAGGKSTGKNPTMPGSKGVVCYHNFQGIADYGKLGHGEVVSMKIPAEFVGDFANQYFALMDRNGDRPDKGDLGGEYRSLVGLPGGMSGPYFDAVKKAADAKGVSLVAGKGNDGDTLFKKSIWVYDTAAFPSYQAEVYHQYHDGFAFGEDYPKSYNNLRDKFVNAGTLDSTGCPDIV